MILGVVKEYNNNRVGMYPGCIEKFKNYFDNIFIETTAGKSAFYSDDEYNSAGAEIKSRKEVIEKSDFIITFSPHQQDIPQNKKVIGIFKSYEDTSLLNKYQEKGNDVFGLDLAPRTTLAQSMDVLSSQGSIDGYRIVLEAANELPDYFPMFITAAGTVKPAKVLILGAGVAGLQAIATAKRLGAVVYAMDTRAATEDEVSSLGGKFVKLPFLDDLASTDGYAKEAGKEILKKQKEAILPLAKECNVIICTAKVRGKKAPTLIDESVLDEMLPGSIVLDLATETGGNCTQSKLDETVTYKSIKIFGTADYASKVSRAASVLYTNNVLSFVKTLFDDEKKYNPDPENEIIKAVWQKPTV